MKNKNRLQSIRDTRLGIDTYQTMLSKMKFESMEEYDLIGKVEDISIYINEGNVDEDKMVEDVSKQKFLREKFLNTSAIHNSPEEDSYLDTGGKVVRYKYEGPLDDKNRDFCSHMLTVYSNQYFRKEDINQMSFSHPNSDFKRYSYWQYSGSYGCRHRFVAYVFSVSETDRVQTTVKRSAKDSSPKN